MASASHHELFTFICRVVKAHVERKDKATETLLKLRNFYEDGRKLTMETHVAEWSNLRERVASLTNDFESENLELQTILGLVSETS